MEKDQPRSGIGEFAKVIITGLFGALIFGPLGYFVNEFLTKDRIEIEHAYLLPETTLFSFLQKDYDTLDAEPRISRYLNKHYNFGELLRRSVHQTNNIYSFEGYNNCPEIIQRAVGINKEEVNYIIKFFEEFIRWNAYIDKRDKEFIKRLESYKNGDNIADIILEAGIYSMAPLYSEDNRKFIAAHIDYYKVSTESTTPRVDDIALYFINKLKNFKQERTGLMSINVAFLNTGNTDGLIANNGILHLVNEEKRIPIKPSNVNRIKKVEKRSMLQTVFEIDEGHASPEDIKVLKGLLINYSSGSVRIEAYDIRGKPILSRNLLLPIDRSI